MSNLFASMGTAGNALKAFETALDITQNNVTNANSPGYAKQVPVLDSLQFQPERGLTGGVVARTQDTRSEFAEAAVRQQLSLVGQYQQLQTTLAPLQGVFDVSANSPIPAALNLLFQSFSSWSAHPGDTTAQSNVINAAGQVAVAFQQTAKQLDSLRASTGHDLQSTVDRINQDAALIHQYNVTVGKQQTPDAGIEAQLHSTLEDLSNLADVQVIRREDGQVTVLLGGQTPLVIGQDVHPIQLRNEDTSGAQNPNGAPNLQIVDDTGADITGQVTSGSLASLLSVRNDLIPSLAGGAHQDGDLNTLAKSLADAINAQLAQGSVTSTPPYQPGGPLFTYNGTSATGIAASLAVDPTIVPGQLAGVDIGPPPVANGNALKLAGLDNTPQVNGLGFTDFFSTLVSRVGTAASSADVQANAQQGLLSQAKTLRQQLSGVSLDEEAVRLVQLQRSYQAASRMISVIDQLTQSILEIQ